MTDFRTDGSQGDENVGGVGGKEGEENKFGLCIETIFRSVNKVNP